MVGHSLHDGMIRCIDGHLKSIDSSSVVVLKRLWDETSMRVQMPAEKLEALLGGDVAGRVIQRKCAGRGGRGSIFPGFTVTSMQSMAYLRWGRNRVDACEVIIPAKIIGSSDSDSIWNGLCAALSALDPAHLRAVASLARLLVVHQFPDKHPSNRVIMQYMAEQVPRAYFLEGQCVAHMLQLVWDAGSRKLLANPLYQCVQLLAHAATKQKVLRAFESLSLETDVVVGIEAQDLGFNDFVLDYTYRRPLKCQSFFTQPGGDRHDADSYARECAEIEEQCRVVKEGLSSSWLKPRCSHNCWGGLTGNRCCDSVALAREKARTSLTRVGEDCLASLKKVAANKWRSISEAVTTLAPGMLIHNGLRTAFERTLATKTELERLQQVLDQYAAQVAGADLNNVVPGTCPQAFRALHGKRIMGVHAWMREPGSYFNLLTFLVASAPIDKLFSTFFECEQFAMTKGGRAGLEARGRTGLLQSLVHPEGILLDVHRMLAQPLFAHAQGPIKSIVAFAVAAGVPQGRAVRCVRMQLLRLSSSFRFRFQGTFWDEEHKLILLLDEAADERMDRLQNFMAGVACPKCEGPFLHRVRERLQEAPVLTDEEKIGVLIEMDEALCEDPLVVSMHNVEVLHAQARQGGARCLDRRKQLPITTFTSQSLTRWRTHHASRIGKARVEPMTVRKTILKGSKKQLLRNPSSRSKSGHNLFMGDEFAARPACAPCWMYTQ